MGCVIPSSALALPCLFHARPPGSDSMLGQIAAEKRGRCRRRKLCTGLRADEAGNPYETSEDSFSPRATWSSGGRARRLCGEGHCRHRRALSSVQLRNSRWRGAIRPPRARGREETGRVRHLVPCPNRTAKLGERAGFGDVTYAGCRATGGAGRLEGVVPTATGAGSPVRPARVALFPGVNRSVPAERRRASALTGPRHGEASLDRRTVPNAERGAREQSLGNVTPADMYAGRQQAMVIVRSA